MRHLIPFTALAVLIPLAALAQQVGPPMPPAPAPQEEARGLMTPERMAEILRRLDPEARGQGNVWQLTVAGSVVIVVHDVDADRMRALSPVRPAADITPEDMLRMMQANFDSALDARYAIARDVLWSAFIHPLSSLGEDQLVVGIGQVVNLQQSYGTLYSSGMMQYSGGDSEALQRQLIDELLEKSRTDI